METKKWKPKLNEYYWYIVVTDLGVGYAIKEYRGDRIDKHFKRQGNCYRKLKEARYKATMIRNIIKQDAA